MKAVITLCLYLGCALFPVYATTETQNSASAASTTFNDEQTLVKVNMSLELAGIEQALEHNRQALDNIGDALQRIALSDNLTPEQQQALAHTLENMDSLVVLSQQALTQFPQVMQNTEDSISHHSAQFWQQLRQQIILVLALLALVVVIALGAIYWFILRPMSAAMVKASANVSSMAQAIQTTAQALDAISQQQDAISQRLEQLNPRANSAEAN